MVGCCVCPPFQFRPPLAFLLLTACLAAGAAAAAPVATASIEQRIPWGPSNIGSRSCPIRYPLLNETRFCLSVGRQRAVVSVPPPQQPPVDRSTAIACVTVEWRLRRFPGASNVGVFVTTPSGNFTPAIRSGGRIDGEVCFETATNVTTYAVYYLPLAYAQDLGTGSYHSHFLDAMSTPPSLLGTSHTRSLDGGAGGMLPPPLRMRTVPATFVRFESQSSFDVRSPMEFAASESEVTALLGRHPSSPYLAWASLVRNTTLQTVRMTSDLPVDLALSEPNATVTLTVPAGGDVRAVQVVLFAARRAIRGVAVDILGGGSGGGGGGGGTTTSSSAGRNDDDGIHVTCLQTTGSNYRGEEMVPPPVDIGVGEVGQLILLVDATEMRSGGGSATRVARIRPTGLPPTRVTILIRPRPTGAENAERRRRSRARDDDGGDNEEEEAAGPPDSSDVWRLSRLAWLNGRTGLDGTKVTRPYAPLNVETSPDGGQWNLSCRGRTVAISADTGLPVSIESNSRRVLASPVVFRLSLASSSVAGGKVLDLRPAGGVAPTFRLSPGNTSASWSVTMQSKEGMVDAVVTGTMEFDGHLDLAVALSSSTNSNSTGGGPSVELDNASLIVNIDHDIGRFAVGGGFADDGDFFPKNCSRLDWSWRDFGTSPAPSGWRIWVGDVDAGLYLKLKGAEDAWNEAEPVGATKPSWAGTDGKSGGIRVSLTGQRRSGPIDQRRHVRIDSFSGPTMVPRTGAPLLFNFSLVATPTKGDYTNSEEGKWEHYKLSRHFHVPYGQWEPPDPCDIRIHNESLRPTTLILHQSNRLNPYINWPFHPNTIPDLRKYIEKAERCGVRVKIYYTVHELTNHAVELFALAGLNGEVLLRNKDDAPPMPGPGATDISTSSIRHRQLGMGGNLIGNEWLLEHLVAGYEGAWFTLNPGGEEDAAVSDNVTSRFLNYYIEGQKWLFDKIGLAGLYYDGFNGERRVQQRIRRMSNDILRDGTGKAIRYDVHGRAFVYTELLPYVDSMWTCEGIDFSRGPAYWLVSISALPFGVFGEMLGADYARPKEGHFCGESCANKWRGMLFGMTNRAGWNGLDPNDNAHLWELWDAFNIENAEMYGWWNMSNPVRVVGSSQGGKSHFSESVFATSYVRTSEATLVAIATWSQGTNETIALEIDWDKLGLSQSGGTVFAPLIPSYNSINETFVFPKDANGRISLVVPAYQGWLLVLS